MTTVRQLKRQLERETDEAKIRELLDELHRLEQAATASVLAERNRREQERAATARREEAARAERKRRDEIERLGQDSATLTRHIRTCEEDLARYRRSKAETDGRLRHLTGQGMISNENDAGHEAEAKAS